MRTLCTSVRMTAARDFDNLVGEKSKKFLWSDTKLRVSFFSMLGGRLQFMKRIKQNFPQRFSSVIQVNLGP